MKTLWCKNQENPSDRISHAWAPLNPVMYSEISKEVSARSAEKVGKRKHLIGTTSVAFNGIFR
jgi:hypothetical protein